MLNQLLISILLVISPMGLRAGFSAMQEAPDLEGIAKQDINDVIQKKREESLPLSLMHRAVHDPSFPTLQSKSFTPFYDDRFKKTLQEKAKGVSFLKEGVNTDEVAAQTLTWAQKMHTFFVALLSEQSGTLITYSRLGNAQKQKVYKSLHKHGYHSNKNAFYIEHDALTSWGEKYDDFQEEIQKNKVLEDKILIYGIGGLLESNAVWLIKSANEDKIDKDQLGKLRSELVKNSSSEKYKEAGILVDTTKADILQNYLSTCRFLLLKEGIKGILAAGEKRILEEKKRKKLISGWNFLLMAGGISSATFFYTCLRLIAQKKLNGKKSKRKSTKRSIEPRHHHKTEKFST